MENNRVKNLVQQIKDINTELSFMPNKRLPPNLHARKANLEIRGRTLMGQLISLGTQKSAYLVTFHWQDKYYQTYFTHISEPDIQVLMAFKFKGCNGVVIHEIQLGQAIEII